FFAPPEVLASMEGSGAAPYATDWVRDLAYAQPYPASMAARAGIWVFTTAPAAFTAAPLPILLGWIAARARLLDEPWKHRRALGRIAVGGIAIGWLTGLPDALVIAGVIPLPDAVSWGFYGLNVAGGMCCGVGYAAAFGLLAVRLERRTATTEPISPQLDREARRALRAEQAAAHRALSPAERAYGASAPSETVAPAGPPTGIVRVLAAVGQRSLSFYLFQSVLLAPLLASWGLGLSPRLSTASAVGIALAVWLLSLPLAAWMESRGIRGPAERLLRRMAYGKHDPRARS